jgi:hypothetical protein
MLHFSKIPAFVTLLIYILLAVHPTMALTLTVKGAGLSVLNGLYQAKPSSVIPPGFIATCNEMRWNSEDMWNQLAIPAAKWFEHDNGSYIYLHKEGRWWMDDPSGAGIYVCQVSSEGVEKVPASGWEPLSRTGADAIPSVEHGGQ